MTATRLPSGDTAGGSDNAPSAPFQTSDACPSWTRQSPSPVPLRGQIEQRRPAEARRQRPAVGTGYGSDVAILGSRSSSGTRHRLAVGFATVATTRRPSRLADTDVYCSRPEVTRRVTLLSTSSAHSHGPDRSSARAT